MLHARSSQRGSLLYSWLSVYLRWGKEYSLLSHRSKMYRAIGYCYSHNDCRRPYTWECNDDKPWRLYIRHDDDTFQHNTYDNRERFLGIKSLFPLPLYPDYLRQLRGMQLCLQRLPSELCRLHERPCGRPVWRHGGGARRRGRDGCADGHESRIYVRGQYL
jgi:hypothetical protein